MQCSIRRRGSRRGDFTQQLLVDAEDGVNRNIAVGVRADLPACEVGLARLGVERLARSAADTAVVAESGIGLREQCSALGDGAVGEQFYRADPYPLIAEAGVQTGGDHLVEFAIVDVRIETTLEFAGIARILIPLQQRRTAVGLARRGDAAACEQF